MDIAGALEKIIAVLSQIDNTQAATDGPDEILSSSTRPLGHGFGC
jgi:hypothetical protein